MKMRTVIPTIYLDNAASTKIDNMVLAEMLPYLRDNYANASSLHSLGRKSRQAIEHAREQVAKSINAESNQVFFVNSATEGNNWVISNFNHVLCSKVEHHSILNNPKCTPIDFDNLANTIYKQRPDLVTCMYVNNEVGTIYNIKEMAKICHQMKVPFHTDATQAFGHVKVDVKDTNVDSLVLSAHKFHGAKGTGILYLKEPDKYKPMLYGGGQEKHLRAGTENVSGIVGMGKACELHNYNEKTDQYILYLKTHLMNFIKENIPDVLINSPLEATVSNILNVSFRGVEGESLMLLLNQKEIYVSSGSACNSGSLEPSYVLRYINVPDDYIYGTIRFSFSEYNTIAEIMEVEKVLKETIEKLRGE